MSEPLLSKQDLLIFYSRVTGWQIQDYWGNRYTPQAFEAEYGWLPDFNNELKHMCARHRIKEKEKEYYAHKNIYA